MASSSLRALVILALVSFTSATPLSKRDTAQDMGFFDPHLTGGRMLTNAKNVPVDEIVYGEPINVIISGHSDPRVLEKRTFHGGLSNYFKSFGFAIECFGLHKGTPQSADLGDGQGWVKQDGVMRWDFGAGFVGSCLETLKGGNHFRAWQQANSNAWFLAVSNEHDLQDKHHITPDGYTVGRDLLVGNATQTSTPYPNNFQAIETSFTGPLNADGGSGDIQVVPDSRFVGRTKHHTYTYETTVEYVSGLLGATNVGVNHNDTVPVDGQPAMDGLVAVLTVRIV